jgi:hypothetical protein
VEILSTFKAKGSRMKVKGDSFTIIYWKYPATHNLILLTISEILPFTNNEFNGITHAIQTLYKINKEYYSYNIYELFLLKKVYIQCIHWEPIFEHDTVSAGFKKYLKYKKSS